MKVEDLPEDEIRKILETADLGGATIHSQGHTNGTGKDIEVEGALPPLIAEGPRTMVCFEHAFYKMRFGDKDVLFWSDEGSGTVLVQYFAHYKKYPIGSKAVQNYIVAQGMRPQRLDRINLRHLVGLRAEVQVENVKPTYNEGALKGQPLPEPLWYSKVSHILRPLGHVDQQTLHHLKTNANR